MGDQQSDRRQGTRDMVDKLLAERQELMVLFCKSAGIEPCERNKSMETLLQSFCQVLVDYTAFAHFEVFGYISSGMERRSRVLKLAEALYPKFVDASEAAVDFNDKYDPTNGATNYDQLENDLSRLGEVLANRVDIEDQLIHALLN